MNKNYYYTFTQNNRKYLEKEVQLTLHDEPEEKTKYSKPLLIIPSYIYGLAEEELLKQEGYISAEFSSESKVLDIINLLADRIERNEKK